MVVSRNRGSENSYRVGVRFEYSWEHSVVHFGGLYLLARALATGEATVILQAFQNNGFAFRPARE